MAKGTLRASDISQHPDRRELPLQGQKRSRPSGEQSEPSQRRRRSRRIEARTARPGFHNEAQAGSRADVSDVGSTYDTGVALEEVVGQASSVAHSTLHDIPYAGTIIVSLDPWPPLEVRTRIPIPQFTVGVTITALDVGHSAESNLNVDIGTLHAVVSLWSADGRIACPHAVPPLLTGRKDATLSNAVSLTRSEHRAEATFTNLAITRPGHYRIRISIMETSLPEPNDDDDVSIGSPRQLLSIESRPIHAHSFAPLFLR